MIALFALVLAATPATTDPVLHDLDAGFRALRGGDHAHARLMLERATAAFDDLSLDGSSLERAFVYDATKPYRGRPWERVLAEVVLAALDIERGRCDLALPALRQAAVLDAESAVKRGTSDAVVVHALALRCLVDTHASDADIGRAADELEAAAGKARAVDVVNAALAPGAVLALDGVGPRLRPDGADGERAALVPSPAPAPAAVVDAVPGRGAAMIRLDHARAHHARGLVVWSSTAQALATRGRAYDRVLAGNARFRESALANGSSMMQRAATTATPLVTHVDAKSAIAALLYAGAGAGLAAAGAVTDARADVRFVDELFERAVLE